jgi:hypothetical protein
MPRRSGPEPASGEAALKRLGGGRWQTRDERFTIEPQSGTWVVVDADQTDDLGLPLVRGPFRSLGEAKDAITTARTTPPATSPLAGRIGRRPAPTGPDARPSADRATVAPPSRRGPVVRVEPDGEPAGPAVAGPAGSNEGAPEVEPAEPRWLLALDPGPRRQARRMIAALTAADAPDAEGTVRRDVVGDVPAVAAFAIEARLAAAGPDADPETIVRLLVDGRDDALDVRWRIVDGDGRPIAIGRSGGRAGRPREV